MHSKERENVILINININSVFSAMVLKFRRLHRKTECSVLLTGGISDYRRRFFLKCDFLSRWPRGVIISPMTRGDPRTPSDISDYPSFLNSNGLCAVRTHESAYLRSPWSRWDRGSRTGRGAGCDVRRPPPSWAPSDGRRLRVNCLLSHWHTGQIPASTRPVTSIRTHAHWCTHRAHTLEVRASSSSYTSSSLSSSSSGLLLLLLPLLLLVAASRH